MSLSRRRFLRAGSLFTLAAGLPLKFANSVFGQPGDAPRKGLTSPLTRGKAETGYYLQHATYSHLVNTTFVVRAASGASQPLELVRADDRRPASGPGSAASGGPEHFSLVFRGSNSRPLPQDVYTLRHDALGSGVLLFVPVVSRDTGARYYEAVINCRRPF